MIEQLLNRARELASKNGCTGHAIQNCCEQWLDNADEWCAFCVLGGFVEQIETGRDIAAILSLDRPPYPTPEQVTERVETHIIEREKRGLTCSRSEIAMMRHWPDDMRRGEVHPWYGPCDGLGTLDGTCSECERFQMPPAQVS